MSENMNTPSEITDNVLLSDLQSFLVVWSEELKGLVDLDVFSPVLSHVELFKKTTGSDIII